MYQVCERRRQYALALNEIPDALLVFIDETRHNLHLSQIHSYAPVGEPVVLQINANRGRNLTAITAISKRGLLHVKFIDGAANGYLFVEFLNELLPTLPPNPVFVMDNVIFHHGELV